MPVHRHVEEKELPAILASNRLAGVTPKVNLMFKCVKCMPLSRINKPAHSGFETQKRHHKFITWVSVASQKGPKIYKKNSLSFPLSLGVNGPSSQALIATLFLYPAQLLVTGGEQLL